MQRRLNGSLTAVALVGMVLAAAGAPAAGAAEAPATPFQSQPDLLKMPDDLYLGEVAGVAANSKGHLFVFTRTGHQFLTVGGSRGFVHGGSRLFEFDAQGSYVREIGHEIYGFMSAHSVRVDREDNIWTVDEGSNVVIKFSPEGAVLMTLGRKPEAVNVPAKPAAASGPGLGIAGDTFGSPKDVGFDAAGDIFVADGGSNARVVEFDKDGNYLRAWGGRGSAAGQFSDPHTLAVGPDGNVYVGDRGNARIQVFDTQGRFKAEIRGVGEPAAICIGPGAQPRLFSSNSNGPADFDHGEIYELSLDGRILGRFGAAGHRLGQFGSVHQMDCGQPRTLYVAEITNWRVQKLTLGQ